MEGLTKQEEERLMEKLLVREWAKARQEAIDAVDNHYGLKEQIRVEAVLTKDGTIVNKLLRVPIKIEKKVNLNEVQESGNSEKNQTDEKSTEDRKEEE